MLSIKFASVEDIPLIRDLTARIWPSTYNAIIGETQVAYMLGLLYSPEALTKQIEESSHRFIICYYSGSAVGFASYSELEPTIYKLHKIYILPDLQGKGIGRYMLDHIVNDIRINKASALRLNVNRNNLPAKSFYEKTGFRHFKEEDIDIGGGFFMNDHVLELSI